MLPLPDEMKDCSFCSKNRKCKRGASCMKHNMQYFRLRKEIDIYIQAAYEQGKKDQCNDCEVNKALGEKE